MIPLFVTNAIDDKPVPLYGDGRNVRDWLHVDDHCRAVDLLIDKGVNGEVYNVGGGNDIMNVELTHRILDGLGKPRSLIAPVADRPGHDRRYCLDTTKLRAWDGRRRCRSPRGCSRRSSGTATTPGGGGRSRNRTRRSRRYYAAQYGTPDSLT